MKNSNLFKLNIPDAYRAIVFAGLIIILKSLYESFSKQSLPSVDEFLATLKEAGYAMGTLLFQLWLSGVSGTFLKK